MESGEGDVRVEQRKRRWCAGLFGVLALALFLLSLILALALIILWQRQPHQCLTPDCIKTAATILNSMDSSVDPCDDFYEFACGKWVAGHPIPDDSASTSNFENLGIEMEQILKRSLMEKETEEDGSGIKKAKHFFMLCLNESEILSTWRSTFDDVLNKHFGWPALQDSWDMPSDFSLEDLYGSMVAEFGVNSVFKFTVQADDKDSSRYVIMLDQPELNLHARDFYLYPEAMEERLAYVQLMEDILVRVGAGKGTARQSALDILAFETTLANATTKEEDKVDIAALYKKVSLREMMELFPHFHWRRFLQRIFREVLDIPYPEEAGEKAGQAREWDLDNTDIVLYGTEFWTGLDRIFSPGVSDRKVMVNYIMWCWFFKEMLRDLPDPFATTLFKFYKTLQIRSVPKLRWHNCVQKTNQLFKWATARLYVHENFNEEAKHKVEMMIDMIMESFHTILEEEDWLTPETKQVARDKVHAIDRKVGYPDLVNSISEIDKVYKDYETHEGNYFRSKFSCSRAEQAEELGRLAGPINRTSWVSGAAVVNAFYSPNTNEIIIPMGILRPVFWSTAFPWSMNFGGIGVVIGHEITHGFDDRGRLYDRHGNIRQWWDNGTIARFEKKAACIEDQYSDYTLEQIDMKVSGKRTKGENIADNGGLKQAFMAYGRWVEEHGEEPRLPGLDLTHHQLFFLNYAQIWCGSMNDKEAIRKLKTAVHSPGPVRVKGPLSNSEEFAAAYSCPAGSRMNAGKKCRVW